MVGAPAEQSNFEEHDAERIHATADSSPRSHVTLKHDDAFAIVDTHGDVGAFGNQSDGFFCNDTRYLSRLELLIARTSPLLLGATLDGNDLQLCCDLTNTDVYKDGSRWLHKDVVHVYRTTFVRNAALRQRLVFTNYGNVDLKLPVSLIFDCDFADIFEVRGMRREHRGNTQRFVDTPQSVRFHYSGLDGIVRETSVNFEPAPASLKDTSALFHLNIPAKQSALIYLTVTAQVAERAATCSYVKGLRDAHRSIRHSQVRETTISVSNPEVEAVLQRAVSDLRMLTTHTSDGPYPYAGTPWYSTTFGRDALITAMQILWLQPSIARGVLRRLARFQAKAFDSDADAQPGKILHEMRGGEMATLREIPFGLYYGSVDSTPLFIVLAGAYHAISGDTEFLREIWPNILLALAWIDGPGDPDQDGFVEYARETDSGLSNQGWKDSDDAVFNSDGSLARGALALVEVQGYVYSAKVAASRMANALRDESLSRRLHAEAEALRERFEKEFWLSDLGLYALALDGNKKPVRARSSNAGHVLSSGIASSDRAARIAEQLTSPNFFSGWGVRTIATSEARYNPMSYHNGSVWPHDNSMIAAGFARYGYGEKAGLIFDSLFDAAIEMDQGRLPELFCGFRRRPGRAPILYPVACAPQAWASGALLHILSSLLGLEIDAASRTVKLSAPRLPSHVEEISVANLRVGEGSVDFVLKEKRGEVTVDVLAERGQARLVRV
ncbi:amylo-alpha-1,6-glucosidase [Hyphomicrobium sp.]|uniref:amylo-alpha-1,6-glucosidase n=1 Tax=Hyphomicrobium sp. TaxID=82 RepID=UPI000FC08D68|nr:amylo-alpha-1,6-glucosidase [Hyphomicrobium sp.]RUO98266.1 MAG: amylo-alpha-1,6-glucosidase [Hyphomicrobium sp.]